jgi:hypothetical protein
MSITSFENLQMGEIWTTFLHISETSLTTTPQQVYDGGGVASSLYLSTTGVNVDNLQVGQITFPTLEGNVNDIPVLTSSTKIEFKSIPAALSSVAPLINGDYSSPFVRVQDGIVTKVLGTGGATKLFILSTRSVEQSTPTINDIVGAVVWQNPVAGDTAYVLQKVTTTANTLSDIIIYKLTYNSDTWSIINQY